MHRPTVKAFLLIEAVLYAGCAAVLIATIPPLISHTASALTALQNSQRAIMHHSAFLSLYKTALIATSVKGEGGVITCKGRDPTGIEWSKTFKNTPKGLLCNTQRIGPAAEDITLTQAGVMIYTAKGAQWQTPEGLFSFQSS